MAVNERAPKESTFPRLIVACADRALPENESVSTIASSTSPMVGGLTERERVRPARNLKSDISVLPSTWGHRRHEGEVVGDLSGLRCLRADRSRAPRGGVGSAQNRAFRLRCNHLRHAGHQGIPRSRDGLSAGSLKLGISCASSLKSGRPLTMTEDKIRHLRVLIANERRERLELLAQVVAGLGHEVIAREIDVTEVGEVTARVQPDVALVGLGLHSEHALELIS